MSWLVVHLIHNSNWIVTDLAIQVVQLLSNF